MITMARFLPIDRDSVYLFPPPVQDWLPEAHLARHIANVIESLDLAGIERAYAGRGSDAGRPARACAIRARLFPGTRERLLPTAMSGDPHRRFFPLASTTPFPGGRWVGFIVLSTQTWTGARRPAGR